MPTLFGTLLQPKSTTQCALTPKTAVQIGEDGRIRQVASGESQPAGSVGDGGCFIVPGFIDAHLHVAQWDRRGIDGLSLEDWQEKIGRPAEARMKDLKTAAALAEEFVSGVIALGTTTVVAFGSSFAPEIDQTFGVFAKRGLRAIYGMTLNDMGMKGDLNQSPDASLDESRQLAAKWHGAEGGRLRYAFSPRASIHCSEKMMRGAGALADMLHCHVQTHIAESLEEIEHFHGSYPEQIDEVDLFSEMGLLTPRTILAHGVFLDINQRQRVAQKGTAIVHCPTANLFRMSGLMDLVGHRAAGMKIALGSSIAGGPEPFMPRVAVEGLQTAKAIKVHSLPRRPGPVPGPAEAWWTLTAGGAQAIGLGEQVGTIAQGFQADCLVVRPEKWITELPPDQQVSALLYTMRPGQIEHVFIAGKRVGPG